MIYVKSNNNLDNENSTNDESYINDGANTNDDNQEIIQNDDGNSNNSEVTEKLIKL